jgi:antitoxin (DNA-binding transcriptional repressor) of toxin-antitoxin stability system
MKIGMEEFRARLEELAQGGEAVVVTKDGEVVGTFTPLARSHPTAEALDDWERRLSGFRDRWRAAAPDWRARMATIGLDEDGEPLPA